MRPAARANSQKRLLVLQAPIDQETLDGSVAAGIDRDQGRELLVPRQGLEAGTLALRHEVLLDAVAHAVDGIGIAGIDAEPAKAAPSLEHDTLGGGLRWLVARKLDGGPAAVLGLLQGDVEGGVGLGWRPLDQTRGHLAHGIAELHVVAAE